MDFTREWTAFALEAEYEDFGPGRIVKAHNARLADLTRELEEAKAEARRWKARAKDAEEEIDGRGRSASTEAMWKERQGDDYGSY